MNDLARVSLMFVVGLAGGLFGAMLLGGGDSAVAAASGGDLGGDHGLSGLEKRVMALESASEASRMAFEDLDGRLVALSRRPDLEELLASSGAAPGTAEAAAAALPAGPAMTAEVRAVIEQMNKEEEQRREAERAQRREERVAQMAERITTELGLDAAQAGVVKQALGESMAAREEIFAQFRNEGGPPPDREAIFAKASAVREAEIAKVSGVLTPEQVKAYTSMTDFGRGFGGDGGRQRGGGGGDANATPRPGGARDF